MCTSALTTVSTCATCQVAHQLSRSTSTTWLWWLAIRQRCLNLRNSLGIFSALYILGNSSGCWELLSLATIACAPYLYVKLHTLKALPDVCTSKLLIWWLHHWITMPCSQRIMAPPAKRKKYGQKKIPYLTAIGSIMYPATTTCPDVSYAVQHLSQFNSNPGNSHWNAAQCVVRYLYSTRDRSLVLGGPEIKFMGWVDSD